MNFLMFGIKRSGILWDSGDVASTIKEIENIFFAVFPSIRKREDTTLRKEIRISNFIPMSLIILEQMLF